MNDVQYSFNVGENFQIGNKLKVRLSEENLARDVLNVNRELEP